MKVFDCLQGTPAWLDARLGIATGSRMGDIITAKQEKPAAAMDGYAAELVAEVLTGQQDPWKWEGETADMRRGTATENQARQYVQIIYGEEIQQVGFILHDEGRWGISPDGLMLPQRGVELKCPAPKTQVKWLADGGLPDEHKAQVHGGMIVTGLPEWLFVSYCIGLPPLIVEVTPNEFTEKLRAALLIFNQKYDALMAKIRARLDEHVLAEIDRRAVENAKPLQSFLVA
jgi:hypothetical protein